MEFYSATKKNEILSIASKWMELENIILNADYRPKTNVVILLDMGQTLRGERAWEE
jgi:hypothetical protein